MSEGIRSALIIREPWIDLVLSGQKSWELRSRSTEKRGLIGLIRKGANAWKVSPG